MKKLLAAVLFAALLAAALTPAMAQYYDQPKLGISIDLPDVVTNYTFNPVMDDETGALGVSLLYVNADAMTPLLEAYEAAANANDDAATKQAAQDYKAACDLNMEVYGTVIGFPTETLDDAKAAFGVDDTYTEIGSNDTYTYYRVIQDELPADSKLTEENKALYEQYRADAVDILEKIKVIPLQTASGMALGEFSTVDTNGNPVDNSILKNADLTLVHIWATYCNPCIEELPDLADWAETLPENVQIIGIVSDVDSVDDETYARAQNILAKAGVKFTNVIMCEGLENIVDSILGTPTTLFFDEDGESVLDPIVGAHLDQYQEIVKQLFGN